MRQLVYDKLKSCELVVFNRFKPDMDKMEFHKVVRAASAAPISPMNPPTARSSMTILRIPAVRPERAGNRDRRRGLCRVVSATSVRPPANYEGKTVRFKCRALKRSKMPANTFIVGRHVMTCCVEDIQFAALVCQWGKG